LAADTRLSSWLSEEEWDWSSAQPIPDSPASAPET